MKVDESPFSPSPTNRKGEGNSPIIVNTPQRFDQNGVLTPSTLGSEQKKARKRKKKKSSSQPQTLFDQNIDCLDNINADEKDNGHIDHNTSGTSLEAYPEVVPVTDHSSHHFPSLWFYTIFFLTTFVFFRYVLSSLSVNNHTSEFQPHEPSNNYNRLDIASNITQDVLVSIPPLNTSSIIPVMDVDRSIKNVTANDSVDSVIVQSSLSSMVVNMTTTTSFDPKVSPGALVVSFRLMKSRFKRWLLTSINNILVFFRKVSLWRKS